MNFRHIKPTETMHFKLTKELRDILETVAKEHTISKSALVRMAVIQFIAELIKQDEAAKPSAATAVAAGAAPNTSLGSFPIPDHYNRPEPDQSWGEENLAKAKAKAKAKANEERARLMQRLDDQEMSRRFEGTNKPFGHP
jgi:hypothetical protein